MRQILTYHGYDVLEATDGLTGLEMARAHMPAVILLDIQMPVMNGFAVIRELRNNPEIRKIKAIAVTSFAMKGDREKCIDAGMDNYLSKPVRMTELYSIIEQLQPKHTKNMMPVEPGNVQKPLVNLDTLLENLEGDLQALENILRKKI